MASAHVRTSEEEVVTLKGTVRERDEALSGAGREIEVLRATIRDRDEALRASEKTCGELRDEVMGWQTHSEELEKEQQAARATATSFPNLFEAKVRQTQLL